MHNEPNSGWAMRLARVAGFCASILVSGLASAAYAGGDTPGYAASNDRGYDAAHQSLIHIPDTGGVNYKSDVHIGLGKSVLVQFPAEIRDVLVSNPVAVDAVVLSSNRVFLLARATGESNAFFFDADGNQFATLEIFVERETAGLQTLLNRLIPGSNIKVEMVSNSVVLTGSVRNPSDAARASQLAKQFVSVEFETRTVVEAEGTRTESGRASPDELVINMLAVEGEEQVMLQVTVAEVQRSLLKQFGINLGADINAGNFVTGLLTENALPLTAAAGLGSLNVAGFGADGLQLFDQTTLGGDSDGAFSNSGVDAGWTTGNQRINGTLRALERNGLIRTLAEPNLTTISGEPAKFLAGGEFPIPVVGSDGRVSVVFKEFGVGVAFTPTVLSEGRISLKIETEVSELTTAGAVQLNTISIPGLQKRQAKSTVELPSGGSLAIAGMLSTDTRQNIDGLPGLKDVPILGTLFRSRDFIQEETELMFIVTPYVVRPVARNKLTTPAKGLASATDGKANFLGHINRVYGREEHTVPSGGLKGDYGFIVE